jgi:hypothetical protein
METKNEMKDRSIDAGLTYPQTIDPIARTLNKQKTYQWVLGCIEDDCSTYRKNGEDRTDHCTKSYYSCSSVFFTRSPLLGRRR